MDMFNISGNIPLALDLTNKLLEIFPAHPRAIGNKIYYEEELEKSSTTTRRKGDDESEELAQDQGVNTIPIKVTSKVPFKQGVTLNHKLFSYDFRMFIFLF